MTGDITAGGQPSSSGDGMAGEYRLLFYSTPGFVKMSNPFKL